MLFGFRLDHGPPTFPCFEFCFACSSLFPQHTHVVSCTSSEDVCCLLKLFTISFGKKAFCFSPNPSPSPFSQSLSHFSLRYFPWDQTGNSTGRGRERQHQRESTCRGLGPTGMESPCIFPPSGTRAGKALQEGTLLLAQDAEPVAKLVTHQNENPTNIYLTLRGTALRSRDTNPGPDSKLHDLKQNI